MASSAIPDQFELIRVVAEHCAGGTGQIVLGNGSNDVLDLIARVFLAPGARRFRAARFRGLSAGDAVDRSRTDRDAGEELRSRPERHARRHPGGYARRLDRQPNNPTGNFLPYPEVRAFLAGGTEGRGRRPRRGPMNTCRRPSVDTAAWIGDFPNLVVTRTFSKIFGLAGLRSVMRWHAAEIADLMNRVPAVQRQPWRLRRRSRARRPLFVAESYRAQPARHGTTRRRPQSASGWNTSIRARQLRHLPGGRRAGVNQKLLKQGRHRPPDRRLRLPRWLRVTIGSEPENARFLEALEKAL